MSSWVRRPVISPFVAYTLAERAFVLGLLVAIALMTLPFAIVAGDASRVMMYGAFALYLGVLALPFATSRFTPGIFHPLVFYVVWVGIQGLLRGQLALPITGLDYHRALSGPAAADLDALVAMSFLLDSVALLSLYAGYSLIPNFRARTLAVPKVRWLALKSMLWVGTAGMGLLALATIGGGLDQVLMQRGIASDQRIAAQVGGQWSYLAGIGAVVPLVWLACDRKAIRNPLFWSVVAAALGLKFASSGSRGGVIMPLIMIGAVFALQHRRVPYRAVLVGVVIALIVVGGLGQFRLSTMKTEAVYDVRIETGPMEWIKLAVEEMRTHSGENSGQLAVLGSVPSGVPHLWGKSYLSIPFIFIPSAIWGEKPDAGGRLLSTRIYNNPLNTIPPLSVGEAYWNFSYPGVVGVFLLFGVTLKLVASCYYANPEHPLVVLIFVYVLFLLQPNSDRAYSFFHALIPLLLIYWSFTSGVVRIRLHAHRKNLFDGRDSQ